MIKEYLKLARSFNAVLTGISPVMGAIAIQNYDIVQLILLFCVGFLGHTFGFVFNDIMDYKIDKDSKDIKDRPLVSGSISIRKAWVFAIGSILAALIIAFFIGFYYDVYFSVILLVVSAGLIVLYDLISKKMPLTDIFLAAGVFFLILYGAFTKPGVGFDIPLIVWIVCGLGAIQVLFMNLVAGGLKDIENDYNKGAKTIAVKTGVRVVDGKLFVSQGFRLIAFFIQIFNIALVFSPFLFLPPFTDFTILRIIQWILLVAISVIMLFLSYQLLSLEFFDRMKARKLIGSHYIVNFTLVPIMLMTLNPWAVILILFPPIGFILSNIIIHGTILQPKTM